MIVVYVFHVCSKNAGVDLNVLKLRKIGLLGRKGYPCAKKEYLCDLLKLDIKKHLENRNLGDRVGVEQINYDLGFI